MPGTDQLERPSGTSPGIDLTGAAEAFQTQAALDQVAQNLNTAHAIDELSKSVVEAIFATTVGVYRSPDAALSEQVNVQRKSRIAG